VIAAPGQASSGGGSGHFVEIVLAGLLLLGGLRSLVKWFRTDFDADSRGERVLYVLFASGRVGTWFALGALFLRYAVLSEPQGIPWWFALLPLGLVGLQVLTGMSLARPSSSVKRGETADPGHPQPEAAEVESARLLANDARDDLRASGLTDTRIQELADEFIALDRGEALAEFIQWAKARAGKADGGRRASG
jgi:hypothetical protein